MMNHCILIGRLAQAPELSYTAQGIAVTKFTLAVDRPYHSQTEKKADFIDVTCWRKLAETCASNLEQGSRAAVHGQLRIDSYTDRNGVRRKGAEIQAEDVRFLGRPNGGDVTVEDEGDIEDAISQDVPF